MKTKFTLLTAVFIMGTLILGSAVKQAASVSGGAPVARTGSPSDGLTCYDGCHGSSPGIPNNNEVIGLSGLPVDGYEPGLTYDLTLSASGSSHDMFGFEISPQSWTGAMQGVWIAGADSWINSTDWLTQTFAGTAGSAGAKSWDFQWIAPTAGTGDVHFYYAVLFADGANAHAGDVMLQDSTILIENTSVGIVSASGQGIRISAVPGEQGLSVLMEEPHNDLLLEVFDTGGRRVHSQHVYHNRTRIDLTGKTRNGMHLVEIRGTGVSFSDRVFLSD